MARSEIAIGNLTYEDFLRFPADGQRHELIGGKHIVTPSPKTRHQRCLRRISGLLDEYVTQHNLGEVFFAPLDVFLSLHDVVEPDLIYVSNNRKDIVTENNIQGAPDLVVEVISENTRRIDRKLKRALYDSVDVVEYWIIDPEVNIIEAFQRGQDGHLMKTAEFEDKGEFTSPLFPDLVVDIEKLFQ